MPRDAVHTLKDETDRKTSVPGKPASSFLRPGCLQAHLCKKKVILTAILTLLACLAAAVFSDRMVRFFEGANQKTVTAHLADEINIFVVNHFDGAVSSLAENLEIKSVCTGVKPSDNANLLNVLTTTKDVLNASIVYVLDTQGTVVGCSPYGDGETLTGNNYKFRPYFFQAVAGRSSTYAAVGVTTGKRGLYFSEPVRDGRNDNPVGVVVIKVSMECIDFYINRFNEGQEILLLSPEGIVFSSTRDKWLYRAAMPISEPQRSALVKSRQFHDQTLAPMPFHINAPAVIHNGRHYITHLQPIDLPGWNILTLRQVKYPYGIALLLVAIILFAGVIVIFRFFCAFREKQLSEEVRQSMQRSRNVEASRLATRRELETILATSLVGITLIRDGVITNVNEKMSDISGYSVKELLGQDIRIFFQDKDSFSKFVRKYTRQLAVRDLEHIEYLLKRKDGIIIPCSLSGKAIDQNDLSQGIVWVVENISESKKAGKELERAMVDAEAASQAKSEFLANMSHEIRTPMNGIIGITEMLLDRETVPRRREQLQLILTSAKLLMKIINDILDFSKNEMEHLELENNPFSLRETLHEVTGSFSGQFQEKNLALNIEINEEVPDIVLGDETRLMQVLYNLVGNGLKFTESGGVTVRLSVEGELDPGNKLILFEVIDTGIGIAPDKQKIIFEAFAQADSSHSRRYGGTGLGLPISRRIVRLMGGDILLESEKGKGSRFWFSMPMYEVCELPAIYAHVPESGTHQFGEISRTKKILLAEDDLINTTLAVYLLEQVGYEVTAVTNGREAVDMWQKEHFDCILMDVQMPYSDGYEAVRQIRHFEEEKGGHIPIIAMTACVMEGDREKCLAAGMDDYLPKPIDRNVMFSLLSHYLNTSAQQGDEA